MGTNHRYSRSGTTTLVPEDEERNPGHRTAVESAYGWKPHAEWAPAITGPLQMRSGEDATYRDDLAFDLTGATPQQSRHAHSTIPSPEPKRSIV